jgi:hypothetical protein
MLPRANRQRPKSQCGTIGTDHVEKVRRRDDFAWTAKSQNLSGRESNGVRASSSDTPKKKGRGPSFASRSDSRATRIGNPRASARKRRLTPDGRASEHRAKSTARRCPLKTRSPGSKDPWQRKAKGISGIDITGAVGIGRLLIARRSILFAVCGLKTAKWRASMTGALHVDCVGNPREPLRMGGVLERAGGVLNERSSHAERVPACGVPRNAACAMGGRFRAVLIG